MRYCGIRDFCAPSFFFRAEDGIRDRNVTGVQTCALPIYPAYSDVLYVDSLIGADTINTLPPQTLQLFEDHGTVRESLPGDAADAQRVMDDLQARSEERRVGNEGSARRRSWDYRIQMYQER